MTIVIRLVELLINSGFWKIQMAPFPPLVFAEATGEMACITVVRGLF